MEITSDLRFQPCQCNTHRQQRSSEEDMTLFRMMRILLFLGIVTSATTATTLTAYSDDSDIAEAEGLINQFYDALGPDSSALTGFLSEGFQIIGSDGRRFDRSEYLEFPKSITSYDVSDIVALRDGDILTATFNIGYRGSFEGQERSVPHLPRLAVFSQENDNWKLIAFAALGTGINDVTAEATMALSQWFEAVASGDANRIRAVVSPDYQIQRSNGKGFTLEEYLSGNLPVTNKVAVMQDLVATSFNNTVVTRYKLRVDEIIDGRPVETLAPRMTVFQRINGVWLVAAHANFAKIE